MILARLAAAALAAATLVPLPAFAQGCAGFADVSASDPLCPSVEWVRNRGITRGCTASAFCPADPVTRLTMAAFLQRLGTALAPTVVAVQETPGALELDVPVRACITADLPPVGYPRTALIDGSVNALASGPRTFALNYGWSTTGGATWLLPAEPPVFAGGVAQQWLTIPVTGAARIDAGATVRFALEISAGQAPGIEATDSRCTLRVLLFDAPAL